MMMNKRFACFLLPIGEEDCIFDCFNVFQIHHEDEDEHTNCACKDLVGLTS
jgi:hypothetical protein